jgi:hypothetical protein
LNFAGRGDALTPFVAACEQTVRIDMGKLAVIQLTPTAYPDIGDLVGAHRVNEL